MGWFDNWFASDSIPTLANPQPGMSGYGAQQQFPFAGQTPPYMGGQPGMQPFDMQKMIRDAEMQSLLGQLGTLGGTMMAASQPMLPHQRAQIMMQGVGGLNRQQYDPMKAALLAMQLQKSGQGPASVQEYEYAKNTGYKGSYEDFKKISSTAPSNVQEYEYYNRLPKEQKDAYLAMKRASPWLNLGGSMALPSQTQPGAMQAEISKTLPPEEVPAVKGQQALEAGRGKTQADVEGRAPKAIAQTDQMIATVDSVLNDPAISEATGMMSSLSMIPGSRWYDFGQKVKQIQGQAFLQAYETLKGGGVITEIEGNKATQSIARLSQSQTEASFKEALNELRGILVTARERSMRQLGPQQAPSAAPTGAPAQA